MSRHLACMGAHSASPQEAYISRTSSGRARVDFPKVRTGCITCKKRKVKCDEAKPFCTRCMRFGIECDGYSKITNLVTKIPQIAQPCSPSSEKSALGFIAPLYQQPVHSLLSSTNEERQYYSYFRETTVFELSGGFDDQLWNYIMLQTCHIEPTIYRIIVSISALSRAENLRTSCPSDPSIGTHRRSAYLEYGKALKGLRDLTESSTNASRNLLLAGLLIYCFESIQGKISSAISSLRTAVSVFLDSSSIYSPPSLSSSPKLTSSRLWPQSSLPTIEPELLAAITRLDGELTRSRLEDHDPSKETTLGIHIDYEPWGLLSPTFQDVTTARRYLEHIEHRARPNISYEQSVQWHLSRNVAQFERVVTVGDMYALQKQLMEWTSALNPLFDYSRTPDGQKDYVACSILRIQSISLRIILGGNMSLVPQFPIPAPDQEAVKRWCRGIVSFASDLVTDLRFLRAYIFGLGILPALFVVAFTAPDREIGKEAVKLMRASKGCRKSSESFRSCVEVKRDCGGWRGSEY